MKGGELMRNEPKLAVENENIYDNVVVMGDTPEGEIQILMDLGFEEEEIEILLGEGIGLDEIMEKYMAVANSEPFNINWTTEDDAINAEYNLNGSQYTKHDIAKDVFNSYFQDQEMSAGKRRKKTQKKRKTRKTKKNSKKRRKNKSKIHRRYF